MTQMYWKKKHNQPKGRKGLCRHTARGMLLWTVMFPDFSSHPKGRILKAFSVPDLEQKRRDGHSRQQLRGLGSPPSMQKSGADIQVNQIYDGMARRTKAQHFSVQTRSRMESQKLETLLLWFCSCLIAFLLLPSPLLKELYSPLPAYISCTATSEFPFLYLLWNFPMCKSLTECLNGD